MQEQTFFNHTHVNSSSTPYSVSSYTQRHNTGPSLYDTSGNLGFGVGRLLREAFDLLYNSWHHWWNPAPSKEVLARRLQVAIYRKRLEAAMVQLDLTVEELRKNPHAKNSFERFKQVVKEYEIYLSPAPTEKLRRYQRERVNELRRKIERLKVKSLRRKLLTYMPSLPREDTSMTDTSDSHLSASDGKRKRSVGTQQVSEFQSSFDLSELSGGNGFVVNGILRGDSLGSSVSAAGDINGDGKSDLVLGTERASNNTPGAAYVIFGQSRFPSSFNLSTLDGANGFVINGMWEGDNFGNSVSTAGDMNGDGKSDLVLGAEGSFDRAGAAYVIFGQSHFPSSFNLSTLDGANGFVINAISSDDLFGISVNTAGDMNGDGKSDLVLGADWSSDQAGAAYVIFGQSHFPSSFNLSTLNGTNGFVVNGMSGGDDFGNSVNTAGDMNGDGKSDLVLGAEGSSEWAGAAYVIFGQSHFPSSFNLSTLNGTNGFMINGMSSDDYLGGSVSTAGDINGDGKSDLVLGAYGAHNTGAAYVIYGQNYFPSSFNLSTLNGTNGFVVNGILVGDYLGCSVNTAGDINGDGKSDFVLGAIRVSDYAGAAYVLFGQSRFSPTFNLTTLNGVNGFVVKGILRNDQLGSSVSTAGDMNGDGKIDLVLGAYGVSNRVGAAYVLFGPTTDNSLPIALIIGSSVGVLFGLGGLIGLGYVLYRRYSSKSTRTQADTRPDINESTPLMGNKHFDSSHNRPDPAIDNIIAGMSSVSINSDECELHSSEKSWELDRKITVRQLAMDKIYELAEAMDQDKRKVVEFYQHCPVTGYEIASVQVIHNPDMNQAFSLHVKKLQHRNNNPAFKAKWPTGRENQNESVESTENTEWRHVVHEQLKTISKSYQDDDYPAVHLVPMWHGTKRGILDSIFKTGYANLATTDAGFFGKGIYSAYEAEYSYRVYAKEGGALIVNWVACFSAYPVIDGDMKKFEGKGNYSNYDAHFIPVVPRDPDNPDEEVYYPTKPYDKSQYTELVVFESVACLPRYLVELQRTLEKPLPLNRNEYRGVFFPSIQEEEKILVQEEENEYLSSNVAEVKKERRGISLALAQEEGKALQQENTGENLCSRLTKLL